MATVCRLIPLESSILSSITVALFLPRQPSHELGFQDAIEYSYFDFFCENTASELSGYFDTSVWNCLVLQIGSHETFAQETIIAIGALAKSIHTVPLHADFVDLQEGRSHYQYAIRRYGKALRLMQHISQQQGDRRIENTLVSSLLTTCFESFIGNQENAIAQGQIGSKILAYHRRNPLHGGAQSFPDNDLFCTFVRLDTQIAMFQDGRRYPHNVEEQSPEAITQSMSPFLQQMPAVFSSAKEARIYWDLMVGVAMRWRAWSQRGDFTTLDFGENDIRDNILKRDDHAQKVQLQGQLYMETMQAWFQAFQPIFDRARAEEGSIDFLGVTTLMIKYLGTRLAIPSQAYGDYQDGSLSDSTTIVRLCAELLTLKGKKSSPANSVFIFDDSIVAGLFLVATRCRYGVVRRQAIELLRNHPRREGLWDSMMAVKVASWFMEKEEQGLSHDIIPIDARFKITKIDFSLTHRKAVVRCARVLDDGTPDFEATLTW
ncbi:hypothetical protein VTL71DRAFT_9342 [Oculimacula yallundae]|uniref:Uncharacterized protein n=1 Tax=Oculimacula yallundae TaxID=86028 RepID=A0ABR4BST4_9HELO